MTSYSHFYSHIDTLSGAAGIQGATNPTGSNLGFNVLLKDTTRDFEWPTLWSLDMLLYLVDKVVKRQMSDWWDDRHRHRPITVSFYLFFSFVLCSCVYVTESVKSLLELLPRSSTLQDFSDSELHVCSFILFLGVHIYCIHWNRIIAAAFTK